MNILITSAGRRVSLLKAFKKELNHFFSDGQVFATDMNPVLSAASHIADRAFTVPRVSDPEYLEKLLHICTTNKISLIIPTIDTELLFLAENKQLFLDRGIQVVVSSIALIQDCRNKREIHKFFENRGISVAQEYPKDKYILPLFIKPYDGSRSVDTFLIETKEDLTSYHFENEKLMFLEYLDHTEYEEFTCDMYYGKDHQLKCVVPRKRIEVRDGEVNKGKTSHNALVPFLKEKMNFVAGAEGCLTVQFFKHKTTDRIVGIEVNARFGGGYPLSYHAGANYPKWIVKEYLLNESVPPSFECWEDNLLMLRYDDEILVHGYKD